MSYSAIRCILIDDEQRANELLSNRLSLLFPELEIAGTFTEWEKGLEMLRSQSVDLLFLDISMPGKTGIDFLKLFPSVRFEVIFITADAGFALDAIKFSAAGYVLKPVDDNELSFAVHKAISRIQARQLQPATPQGPNHQRQAYKIGVPGSKGIDYINAADILYFESINKYTKVVTRDHSLISSYNLAAFRSLLDESLFFQVHRSYVINMQWVKRYELPGMVVMEDGAQIPVSRNLRQDFLQQFGRISKTARLRKGTDDQ